MPVREWDGASYDRISGPMEALGRAVLDRLQLAGDEIVLDAGCGSGRVTEALIERLPRGHVVAFDASPSMVRVARERLGDRALVCEGDLLDLDPAALDVPWRNIPSLHTAGVDGSGLAGSGVDAAGVEGSALAAAGVEVRALAAAGLDSERGFDAIFSTATFHWIGDHDRLFARLRAVLRPGGQLVAQCGGEGNIDVLRATAHTILEREPYAEHFRGWAPPWNYAAPDVTRERLLRTGFAKATCWLTPAPQQPEHPREFLSTIVLGPHVQRLPPDLRQPFMDSVLAELPTPVVVDYVRLNIDATA
jgi:trans-aconitate 2-methyltransferase